LKWTRTGRFALIRWTV